MLATLSASTTKDASPPKANQLHSWEITRPLRWSKGCHLTIGSSRSTGMSSLEMHEENLTLSMTYLDEKVLRVAARA